MSQNDKRIERGAKTIELMIEIYCKDHHKTGQELCEKCSELYEYAMVRLDKCKYGDDKPTCAKCPTHCYKPSMREEVRKVMRYSGPRMMKKHPVLAIQHLIDGKKKPPELKKNKKDGD
jgi:hypothetical protein